MKLSTVILSVAALFIAGVSAGNYEFNCDQGFYLSQVRGRIGRHLDQVEFQCNNGKSSSVNGGGGGSPFGWTNLEGGFVR